MLPEHHEAFTRLLKDPVIQRFLAWDTNLKASDKDLLAMVITYFSQAGLFPWQFQRTHVFLALYQATDMVEEDNQEPKLHTFFFLYGMNFNKIPQVHNLCYQFIGCMDWNFRVTREDCEEIQAYNLRSGCGAEIVPSSQDPGALRTSTSRRGAMGPGI
ncbi:speedy protein E4-like [Heterocephalus glaber]|uniref:Speedy protein E4-like n=1 Tax=Heterocephalus glaber TaxID=10181 RepID=A0AAX6RSE6_HETGA|nr:speedy protein E4-like [Heterocephalus glaber]